MADPGFSRGGGANPKGGGANLLFGQFSPKTAWKWRNFGPGGRVHAPLRSATGDFYCTSMEQLCFRPSNELRHGPELCNGRRVSCSVWWNHFANTPRRIFRGNCSCFPRVDCLLNKWKIPLRSPRSMQISFILWFFCGRKVSLTVFFVPSKSLFLFPLC